MGEIHLNGVHKNGCAITYDYSVTDELSMYFTNEAFVIEYPENIEAVPDAIAAIPFVCNVLPVIWLTDSDLRIEELDESFYCCIEEVRQGYETMFPETHFNGRIIVDKIKGFSYPRTGKSAVFFSGGADAVHTLIQHLDECPVLLSVWGSDIAYDNESGWKMLHKGIAEYADVYGLKDVVIHSSFRSFDNEGKLDACFHSQLKDGWWHGVKHGIGLLGHAAPYAFLHEIANVYIASSHCPADGHVRCASNPLTDNHVRFASTRVVHDGFEYSRQDKLHNIAQYVKTTGNHLSLHVCWESQSGGNCCRCEKCYRTMVGLIAEGEDPVDYGFSSARATMPQLRWYVLMELQDNKPLKVQWVHIQKALRSNWEMVRRTPYQKSVRWILSIDCANPEKIHIPWWYRVKQTVVRGSICYYAKRTIIKLYGLVDGRKKLS